MQDEYVLDTETVRASAGDVRAAMARAASAVATCAAIRPRFAELLAADACLASELRAPPAGSEMAGRIGRWLLVHDHFACGFVGPYRGTEEAEVFAPRMGSRDLVEPRALAAGDAYALLASQDDVRARTSPAPSVSTTGEAHAFRSGSSSVECT